MFSHTAPGRMNLTGLPFELPPTIWEIHDPEFTNPMVEEPLVIGVERDILKNESVPPLEFDRLVELV